MMIPKISTAFWLLVWCIFMGVMVGSIGTVGINLTFPAANLAAWPFVCLGGQMQSTTQNEVVNAGEGEVRTWYCIDPKKETKTELNLFPWYVFEGAISGLVLFCMLLFGMMTWGANPKVAAWWKEHSGRGYYRGRY